MSEIDEEGQGKELVVTQPEPLSIAREPALVLQEAKMAAAALNDVISKKKKPVIFNNEQYLEFEDWQTVGRFYGVTCKEDGDPEAVEVGDAVGFKASAVALRADGAIISRATAYCMKDEPNWEAKPIFQLASMAQTRACAKALRNVLSWVVVLAGYRPTPAEEITTEKENGWKSKPKPWSSPKELPPEDLPEVLRICPEHKVIWMSGKFGLYHKQEHGPACNEKDLGAWLWKNAFMPNAKKAGMKDIIDIGKWYEEHDLPNWDKQTPLQWTQACDKMAETAANSPKTRELEEDDIPH